MSKKSVFCIATSLEQAAWITAELKAASFPGNTVSVLFLDQQTTRDFDRAQNTNSPSGAGGGIEATFGWLVGMGSVVIPGAGQLIAAGPVKTALSGTASGTPAGSIASGLIGLGIPELVVAQRYAGKVQAGNILLAVQSESSWDISRARNIFTQAGAQDICTPGEESSQQQKAA